jgi:hypothetical protein
MSLFADGTPEAAIERKYVSTLCQLGLSVNDANDAFLRFARQTEGQDAKPRVGDALLEFAETDLKARAAVAALITTGVTEDDIRSWYNMHPLEAIACSEFSK